MFMVTFNLGKDNTVTQNVEAEEAVIWESVKEANEKGYYQYTDRYSGVVNRIFMNQVKFISLVKIN